MVIAFAACAVKKEETPPTPWAPGTVLSQTHAVNARGFVELRGLIHAHSIYSHDACDGAPHDENGVYNQPCLADFRFGACAVQHDFFFLTDHGDSFESNEFPDVLLYDSTKGDELISRGGGPVANKLKCPSGSTALVMAGTETGTMPVGLEGHLGAREYGRQDNEQLDAYRAANGVTLVPHLEDWTEDQLTDMHLDGFEMFNLHRNALQNAGVAADLLFNYVNAGKNAELPHPDLFLASFVLDDPLYLQRWGTVLSRGAHRVTTFGSDCHQNTFPDKLADGERIDSYRRMMAAFSNHLLVRPKSDGTWDDANLKDALREGRNFGVFEFLGYAEGFDFYAREGSTSKELGETATAGSTLVATMPHVRNLDTNGEQPTLTMILYKAKDGGWDEVARTSDAKLEFVATVTGAYRVEVRMVPRHLRPWANQHLEFFRLERPWVMSSALYVQ